MMSLVALRFLQDFTALFFLAGPATSSFFASLREASFFPRKTSSTSNLKQWHLQRVSIKHSTTTAARVQQQQHAWMPAFERKRTDGVEAV